MVTACNWYYYWDRFNLHFSQSDTMSHLSLALLWLRQSFRGIHLSNARSFAYAMLLATTLQAENTAADPPNYFTVTEANPDTVKIDGAVLADPNGADFDGLLFSRPAVDFETLRLRRDVPWYTPAGGFNKKYEHIRVEGNDRNADILTVFSELGISGTGCPVNDFKVRSLELDNASFVVSDQESGTPSVPGCVRPIDFFVSSNNSSVSAEVNMKKQPAV